MTKIFKTFFILSLSLLAFGLFLPCRVQATDTCTENSGLQFVGRNPDGSFIPQVQVDVYRQTLDADGNKKPSTRVAGGTTNATLGTLQLKWRIAETAETYAIRVRMISKTNASFWYYDNNIACGQSLPLEKTLSGINLTLRNIDGEKLANQSFNVYSQLYDNNGAPLRELRELLFTGKTDIAGKATIYLPQGSRHNLDGSRGDHYTVEVAGNNLKFRYYSLPVIEGQMTDLDYQISSLDVKIQDPTGALYPSGTPFALYKQEVDQDNNRQKGDKIGTFSLNDDGYSVFAIPAGLYVLTIKGQSSVYQDFWDVEVLDGRSNQYTITSEQTSSTLVTSCESNSKFNLTLRNYSGTILPGLKFELYEQKDDVNNLPMAGTKIGGGTISASGQASLSFKPDPRKLYAIKVWDKRSDLGEFWFFSAVRFVCGYDRNVTENLPALKIVLRDSQKQLLRKYNFSLYAQRYDADNKPYIQSADLIANLATSASGQTTVYVSPFNNYRRDTTGAYAISAKDSSGNTSVFYNINIPNDKDYTFESVFSGLTGELRDASSRLLGNRELRLYENTDSGVGKQLLKSKTDAKGLFKFDYPAGTYILKSLDDLGLENNFGQITLKAGSNNQKLIAGAVSFGLGSVSSGTTSSSFSLSLYSLTDTGSNIYVRNKQVGTVKLSAGKTSLLSLAAGPYLVVYTGKDNQEFGQAFYVNNDRHLTIKIAGTDAYKLSAGQSFRLAAGSAAPLVTSNSGSSSSSSSSASGSLSNRLKGRILLQVEDKGQAWYVNPSDSKKYYLGRPDDAFELMRRVGLGISNADFASLEKNPSAWKKLAGKILLKVEDSGKAYYFDPVALKLYYLGRPSDAFNVMRSLGLGIKTSDLSQIGSGVN